MIVNKEYIKKLIQEEATKLFLEAKIPEPIYTSPNPPRQIGEPAAPGSAKKRSREYGEHLPSWPQMSQAIEIILKNISLLKTSSKEAQQDRTLDNIVLIIRQLVSDMPDIKVSEGMGIYRFTQDQWEKLYNFSKYIKKALPNYLERIASEEYFQVVEMAEFIERVSVLRYTSMSLGMSLADQEVPIPSSIKFKR